jgi:hypothetical protein
VTASELVRDAAVSAAAIVLVWILVHFVWRTIGAYRIRRAGPRPLHASRHVIWRDPGRIEELDPVAGPGGPGGEPMPPFRFLEEHTNGSQPCVSVKDARNRTWRVKWGKEVRAENLAVRLAWSCGYFAEVTYFVPEGTIVGANGLQRASECITVEGRFAEARFELDDAAVKKLFEEHSWAWDDNPFVGTRELSGLKILVMMLSNWDTKDRRDVARGSNTAIFEHVLGRGQREARYLLTDWGGAMGRWGTTPMTRATWDVGGFEEQTAEFISGVRNGAVCFGYTGQRTSDVAAGISIDHARWFHSYARQLTEEYLVRAVTASGGTDDEATRFAKALIERIRLLGEAVEPSAPRFGLL